MSQYTYQNEYRAGGFSGRITWAVQRLILANVIVFALQLLIQIPFGVFPGQVDQGPIIDILSFQPLAFLHGGIWKPFTYMFLHAGVTHLLFNMLWLYFFGCDVERVLSTRQFFRFYVLCGAVGVLGTLLPLILMGRLTSVLGASGAVMGVLVAFAMINPDRELFFFPIPVPISARGLVFIVIVWNLVTGWAEGGVSVATHLGGMATGYAYMKAVPLLRKWSDSWENARRAKKAKKDSNDPVGKSVDNIFEFDKEKRRRKF